MVPSLYCQVSGFTIAVVTDSSQIPLRVPRLYVPYLVSSSTEDGLVLPELYVQPSFPERPGPFARIC